MANVAFVAKDPFMAAAERIVEDTLRDRERLLKAWIAETGLLPSQSVMFEQVIQPEGSTLLHRKVWIERRNSSGPVQAVRLEGQLVIPMEAQQLATALNDEAPIPPGFRFMVTTRDHVDGTVSMLVHGYFGDVHDAVIVGPAERAAMLKAPAQLRSLIEGLSLSLMTQWFHSGRTVRDFPEDG